LLNILLDMATLSVRNIAKTALGITGAFSVNTHLYGYIYRDTNGSLFGTLSGDTLPGERKPTTRSLKRHLTTISDKSVNLDIILVGHEDNFSGAVSRDDVTKIQYAIQVARDLYAQAPLGIRRLTWTRIPQADAGGYVNITDSSEAEDLTDDWSGPDGGVDIFFVQSIGDASGWSNVEGPCDKDSKDGRTGAVIQVSGARRFTGIVLGHELGHYLGLEHTNSTANMMGEDADGDGIGQVNDNSTNIPSGQRATMRRHCSIVPPI
jgi:hypothetical protein